LKHNVRLQPWEEIVGVLHSFENSKSGLCLKIGYTTLSFAAGSKEASCILEQINKNAIGREVAILRTDFPDKPILIRAITKSEEYEDPCF
jgi:hypothetical protein